MDNIRLDHKVLIDELRLVMHVGVYAPDFRCCQDNTIGLFGLKKFCDSTYIGKVHFI